MSLYSVTYTRDALGRIASKTERVGAEVSHTFSYSYDFAGHLSDAFKDGTPIAHYAYDSNGNRTAGPGLTSSPAYDAQDRLTGYGACTYTYKADGSLQTKTCPGGATSYDYDALGNLRHLTLPSGTNIDYVIDGQNRRIGKKGNGALIEAFLYRNQLQPAVWLNGDGSVRATFVYGLHPNLPEYMVQGGTTYRLFTDQIGSVRLVVNTSTGGVAERVDYDEFGNALSDSAPGFQPFGFAGGLRDLDTGLTRFGARDYDPVIGRWTARDPLLFEGRQLNLYSYVAGDPVNRLDPRGLSWLVYDPNTQTTTFYGRDGTPLAEWPAGNNVLPGRSVYPYPPLDPGFAPGGRAYEFDYYKAHPESDATGPYGSNGNFVFQVTGHRGIGFHAGRFGPDSPTNGCYRSTDEATSTVFNATCGDLSPEECEDRSVNHLPLPGSDPLQYLYVLPYNPFP